MALTTNKKKTTSGTYDISNAVNNIKTNVTSGVSNVKNTISTATKNATNGYNNMVDTVADYIPGYTLLGSAIKSQANTRAYKADQAKADTNLEALDASKPGNYTESEALLAERENLKNVEAQGADIDAKYGDRVQDALNRIDQLSNFNYDVASDPLWNSIKSQYQRNATMGMMDTIGNMSNLTGGYASSYSQQAGQQAYQNAIADMTNIIPELQDSAINRWSANMQGAKSNLEALYDVYKGEIAEWQNNRDYFYNKVNSMSEQEYQQYKDQLAQWNTDRNFWSDYRNQAIANQQWQMQLDEQKSEFRQEMLYNAASLGVDLAKTGMSVGGSLASTGINAGVDLVGIGADLYNDKLDRDEDTRRWNILHADDIAAMNDVASSGSGKTSGSVSGSGKSSSSGSGSSSGNKPKSTGSGNNSSGNNSSGGKSTTSNSSSYYDIRNPQSPTQPIVSNQLANDTMTDIIRTGGVDNADIYLANQKKKK